VCARPNAPPHCSINTEASSVRWTERCIHFRDKPHPKKMDVPEIEAVRTHLAVERNVAAST
jgi:hypothetical protein